MLVALVSLFLVSLFGLGLVPFARDVNNGTLRGWQIYFAGITGLVLSQIPIYLGASQRATLPFVLVIGTGMVLWAVLRRKNVVVSPWRVLALLPLAGYVTWRMIADPLHAHDAYSIWFFHARMLFFDQGFFYPHWQKPEILFARPDYPKAASLLASQVATLMGFWNDYLPKANLVFYLTLAELGIFLLPFSNIGIFVINAIFLRLIWDPLWWGYMDGWVGLFGFLTAVQLGYFLKGRGRGYLSCALATAALLCQIKNEGTVLAAVLLGSAFGMLAWRRKWREMASALDWRHGIPFVSFLLWTYLKKSHHLTNYFARNFSWDIVREHLCSSTFWSGFVEYFFLKYPMALAIPAFLAFFLYRRSCKEWRWDASLFVLVACVGYSLFILSAFVSSPMDFPGHYKVAMDRLCMAPAQLLFACAVLQWDGKSGRA